MTALPQPRTAAGRAGLAALLAAPRCALLGLDFDGTLAPIVDDPDAARGHPGVPAVLHRLTRHGVRVAVVTGRPAATAADYAGLGDLAGLVVLGHYGRQRWQGGIVTEAETAPGVAVARRLLPAVLARAAAPPGTYVEDKQAALAVHTRRTADPPAAVAALRPALAALAGQTGLVLEPGRFVLELRPAGADKGSALRALAAERTPSAVGFVGDDLGDLAAFAAVEGMRRAGTPGLLVCSGSTEETALAARADLVVDGPDGVVALLSALADALDARGGEPAA